MQSPYLSGFVGAASAATAELVGGSESRLKPLLQKLINRVCWLTSWSVFGVEAGDLFKPAPQSASCSVGAASAATAELVGGSESRLKPLLPKLINWVHWLISQSVFGVRTGDFFKPAPQSASCSLGAASAATAELVGGSESRLKPLLPKLINWVHWLISQSVFGVRTGDFFKPAL